MTWGNLTFTPVSYAWVWVAAALLAGGFAIYKEWRRPLRFRAARVVAATVCMAAVALLVVRPSVSTETDTGFVILLTKGYGKNQVDSLKKIYRHAVVKQAPDAAPYPGSDVIRSFNELGKFGDAVRMVVGRGLPEYALQQVSGVKYMEGRPEHGRR
ncbi:MAG: hypothetical protein HC859_00680 [Bacteroidia bacterium]|nr:hypothetical protein [Bacteroidia bacterium]